MTRTASCYTHKVQVVSTASNLKVEYPGKIAVTPQPLAPTLPCFPSYSPITYVPAATCPSYKPACARPINPEFLFQWKSVEETLTPGPGEFSIVFLQIEGIFQYIVSNIDLSGTNQTSFLQNIPAFFKIESNLDSSVIQNLYSSNNGTYEFIAIGVSNAAPVNPDITYPNYLFSYGV